MLRVHDHAVARGEMTGGGCAPHTLDVDETGAAGAGPRGDPGPSRHGVHWPQDSRALNASSVRTASRTEAPSSRATTPPVPGLTLPREISGSSNCRGWTMLPEGPPTTAAPTARSQPPPTSSISV